MILNNWFFQNLSLNLPALVLLYAGPDQILPLVSGIATIIGVLLIWWQRFVKGFKKSWRFVSDKMQRDKSLQPSAKEDR